jgi:hypothetical protein
MSAEIWESVGTVLATLVLFIVPGLVYTWYALEHIGPEREVGRSNPGTGHE